MLLLCLDALDLFEELLASQVRDLLLLEDDELLFGLFQYFCFLSLLHANLLLREAELEAELHILVNGRLYAEVLKLVREERFQHIVLILFHGDLFAQHGFAVALVRRKPLKVGGVKIELRCSVLALREHIQRRVLILHMDIEEKWLVVPQTHFQAIVLVAYVERRVSFGD